MKKLVTLLFILTSIVIGCDKNDLSEINGVWEDESGNVFKYDNGVRTLNNSDEEETYKEIGFDSKDVEDIQGAKPFQILIKYDVPNGEPIFYRQLLLKSKDGRKMTGLITFPVDENGDNLPGASTKTQTFTKVK